MANIGENIAKLRGMRRLTQKQMAAKVGLAQPEYSKIEQKSEIDDDLLELIANALEVSPDALRNFNEQAAINIITSSLGDNAGSINHFPTFNLNPIDKLMEVIDENKRLYERLLKEKDDMIEMYKKQLKAS